MSDKSLSRYLSPLRTRFTFTPADIQTTSVVCTGTNAAVNETKYF